ncbi:YheC/YheD family protein [Paenibacillus sp. GCM10027626]|uniref:YheC/YheD family endospore coat-associated protein n=1 Tax=Paenibacillus sp. GCM10027626 TaxID=3273411 RepID=UPI003632A494
MTNHRRNIGVLISDSSDSETETAQLPESGFCRELCSHGAKLGLFVYLFRASSVKKLGDTITGFVPAASGWKIADCPLPDVIYDRSMERGSNKSILLEELRKHHSFLLLNGSLPGKWIVYNALQQDPSIRPLLPPTCRYEGHRQLMSLAKQYKSGLFLKPIAGCQGRGALCMQHSGGTWSVSGRTVRNHSFHRSFPSLDTCTEWIGRFIRSASYIVQPYLQLKDKEDRAFDIRTLIQKDKQGEWSMTGTALREGASGSITANLHGGGAAQSAQPALAKRYGEERALALLQQIQLVSMQIALRLEKSFGRLCELGLDFGIDQDGRLWFIEANSKPGRLCMREVTDIAAQQAALKPLQYASLLIQRRSPLLSVHCQIPADAAVCEH